MKPRKKIPKPIPIRLLMNRKLAEAVARMLGGTMCWTAAITGPSQASASIWPIANRIQPSAERRREQAEREDRRGDQEADRRDQGIGGRVARARSRSPSQPPSQVPAMPPTSTIEP